MSRDEGFAIADVDVGYLDDPKVRRLIRSTTGESDDSLVARCVVLHVAVLLASWRGGDRVAVDDAAPIWLSDVPDLVERLAAAGLLDDTGRIPEGPWESWFGPARDRRNAKREGGRKGGVATHRA